MAMRNIVFIVMVIGVASLSGCHMFEDAENVDSCPLNSGYPCPCDVETHPLCDDNATCLPVEEGSYRGICSNLCRPNEPEDCEAVQGFGVEGVCHFDFDGNSEVDRCAVVCHDKDDNKGACPPGTQCEWQSTPHNFGICLPKPLEIDDSE